MHVLARDSILCLARYAIVRPSVCPSVRLSDGCIIQQESPAIADKPARRESLPQIAPIRRAYNVVVDNTGLSSFVYLLLRKLLLTAYRKSYMRCRLVPK